MGFMDEKGTKDLNGRKIHYKIKRGFSNWQLRHEVEIKDIATGIVVKSGRNKSVDTSWRKAKERFTSALMAAGHLNTSPPVVVASQTPIDTSLVNPTSQNLSDATQQEKATAQVAEAMEEGTQAANESSITHVDINEARDKLGYNVTVDISTVTLQGPPATGKTSVIDLAMGRPPAMERHSTGIAEPPSCFIIVGDDTSEDVEWEEFSSDRMLDMVCETIEALAKSDDHLEPAHDTASGPTDQSHMSSVPSTSACSPSASLLIATPPAKRKRYDFPQILRDIMQRLPRVRGSASLFHARLLLISDSGGQPNFLDIFPLFVRNKCLALYTLKLNERLDAIPEFSYCIKGRSISMADTMLQYSYWQLLESLAKSMSSFLPALSLQSPDCRGNACFTVIGTFADRMNECEDESLEDKNINLVHRLKAYEQLRIKYKSKAILPINAVTGDKVKRREYMMELRRQINRAPSIKVTIKLRWFVFYLTLLSEAKAKERAILSLQECLDIGRSLDMDEQETRKAITFFHNLNLILHYQTEELDMLVIVVLKPILDLVSLLIGSSFINKDELLHFFSVKLPAGFREHFQQYGCFDQQTLENCFQFPDLLSAKAFIHLLAEIKAIAVIKKANAFFMPCVLRYASKAEKSKIVSDLPCPWIVRLKVQRGYQNFYTPLPPGFSPTLIVLLLPSDSFSINEIKNLRQYRNIFVLQYLDRGYVTIVERQDQLEIYYSFRDSDCFAIRSLVHKAILETEKRLSFDVDTIIIEDSFPCSCNPPQRESRHILCKPIPESHTHDALCVETGKSCELKEYELRWLSSAVDTRATPVDHRRQRSESIARSTTGSSHTATATQQPTTGSGVSGDLDRTLTENDLCDVLAVIQDLVNWMELGLQLGLLYSTLKKIEIEQRSNVSRCKIEMLSDWLQKKDNVSQKGYPSWSVLRAALKQMGEDETADRICN